MNTAMPLKDQQVFNNLTNINDDQCNYDSDVWGNEKKLKYLYITRIYV